MRTARASEDMGVGRGAARPDAHESLAKVAIVAQKSMRGDRIRQGRTTYSTPPSCAMLPAKTLGVLRGAHPWKS